MAKNFPTTKSLGRNCCLESYWMRKKEHQARTQTPPENKRGGSAAQLAVWGQRHPDAKPGGQPRWGGSYRPISPANTDVKIYNRLLANWAQQCTKRVRNQNRMCLSQECKVSSAIENHCISSYQQIETPNKTCSRHHMCRKSRQKIQPP